MSKKGVTLVEILVSVFIVSLIAGAALLAFPHLFEGVNVASQKVRAWEAARQEIEILKRADFDAALYNVSYDPTLAETPIANRFTTGVPGTSGVYYVERMYNTGGVQLTDLVNVEVVVCLRVGNRTMGEDTNLNGVLDAGEDRTINNRIDSPVMLRTLITR